jgi:hypothetical protein
MLLQFPYLELSQDDTLRIEKKPHIAVRLKIWGARDDGAGHWIEVINLDLVEKRTTNISPF